MLTVDPRLRATIHDIAEHEWVVAGQSDADFPETHETKSYAEYLEACESGSDLNNTLKATDVEESMQPKSILKHKNGSGDESPTAGKKQSKTGPDDENSPGQMAVACGLHAKDSLKLKAKPQSASGKRRVLRSRRDRESGYYSSPERANASKDTIKPSESTTQNVPQIKSSLMAGKRLNKLGMKPTSVHLRKPPLQSVAKECYLMPINPGPDERMTSVSSDDGCSVGSLTRPASTYSDSSILSSDSFDLCTFDGAGPNRNESNNISLSNTPHRPSSLPLETPNYISENPPGTLTPKSEKLVRDLQRILAPTRRRRDRTPLSSSIDRPLSMDENSNLSAMVNQLNVELDLAYKKGVDVCANLKPAEV